MVAESTYASLVDAIRAAVRDYPHHPAILERDRDISFLAFDQQSDAIATKLLAGGLLQGERVALYCPNSAEFALVYVGILKAGGVVVPINLLLSLEEITYLLNDVGVSAWLFHADLQENVAKMLPRLPALRFSQGISRDGAFGWSDWLSADSSTVCFPQLLDPTHDLAVILYTSGTTGRPKGAMLTHANLLANTASVRSAMKWHPGEDRVLLVLPMFHAFAATVGMLTPLTSGCALIPLSRFDPETVAERIKHHDASIFLGVPSMYSLMLRLREDKTACLAGLRFCVSGGAALPLAVLEAFQQRFGVVIYEGDGPTECSPVTCVNPIDGRVKPGTVGLPVPGVEMCVVDEKGERLPHGQVGEVAVRGANVFKGYWNQPEATAESFCRGWFLTGDLGAEDEDGYFTLVDRKKDMIIVNGMNVYPRVIEEAFMRHPNVKEIAVVGEPDPLHGELPVAHVVLDSPVSEADLRIWSKQYLGRHELPRRIYFCELLPRNAAGKIIKRELRRHGELERGVL